MGGMQKLHLLGIIQRGGFFAEVTQELGNRL